MARIEEVDEIMSLIKDINNAQSDRRAVMVASHLKVDYVPAWKFVILTSGKFVARAESKGYNPLVKTTFQAETLKRQMEALSETVRVQKEQNEKKKEMQESLNRILNREREQSAAISACKSTFARGHAEPLLWFAKAEVKKSKLLQELKQNEVEKQIKKLIDDHANRNPKYRQLKQKQMQLAELEDEIKKKREETASLQKFIAKENAVEDMMWREQVVDLAVQMVKHNNNNFPKAKPDITSVAKRNKPMNEDEQLKSFISAEPMDAELDTISDFKMPLMRHAVKRKAIEASVEPARTVSSDEFKFKFPTVAKASKAPRRSILKSKEVKTTKMPSASATLKQSQESDKLTIQKKNENVPRSQGSNLSSPLEHSEQAEKQKPKTVQFVGLNSSVESDIVSLSGTSQQNKSTSKSKSTSIIDIAMVPSGSDGSDIETDKENILKERTLDENMELASNASSIQSSIDFDVNFTDSFSQFTTPIKSKPSAASTDADLDSDDKNQSFDLDFGRSPLEFRISPNFQAKPDITSVAKRNKPMNEDEQLKSFISAEPIDAELDTISDFKMPLMRHAVKRKAIEASVEPARTVSSDEFKFKFPTVAKASKAPRRSILKSKEVKTTKMPSASATLKQSQESDKLTIQKKNENVPRSQGSNLSSPLEHSEQAEKQKQKTVQFVGLNSSVESDIVSLSGTSQQNKSTSKSKSTSIIDIAMVPSGSDGSDIETDKENILKERTLDENMELASNASSIQSIDFDVNFTDSFSQFTTPIKSKPSAASTDADLDSDDKNQSFDLDFGRSPLEFRISPNFQSTSDDAFNFLSTNEADYDFSSLFK